MSDENRAVSSISSVDTAEWEKVDENECYAADEAQKLATRLKRDDLIRRWRRIVDVVSAGSRRGEAIVRDTEQLLRSLAENEKLVAGWEKGKATSRRALDRIQTENDDDWVESIRQSDEIKETVDILGDFRQEESYIALLTQGRKLFDNPSSLGDDEESLVDAMSILRRLEESETFARLKSHAKVVLEKFCDAETMASGMRVYDDVKASRELKEIVSGGKRLVTNIAKGEEEDLGVAIETMVDLGEELVKHVRRSDAGAVLIEKGKETVQKFANSTDEISQLLRENEEFIDELKAAVVPWIRDRLLAVELPIVRGIRKSKIGEIDYELKSMRLHGLDIPTPPRDAVTLRWKTNTLTIEIRNVEASMRDFEWSYRKLAFPHWKDDGLADVDVFGGTCAAVVQVTTDVDILDLSVKFETLRLRTHGTKASWLYNLIISWFRKSIEKALHESANQALERHALSLSDVINNVIKKYLPKIAAKLTRAATESESEEKT